MRKQPVKARELDSASRINGFEEVVLGYSEEEALAEAGRCLQCKNPACIKGCPVGIDIKKFIYYITQKDYASAYLAIREKNNFPSICGRVCPAEYQCRKACVLNRQDSPFASEEAINIHFLERFAGDYGINGSPGAPALQKSALARFKVAVVGSGPAGLCCAGELARQGVRVTIFESLHEPGGVLRYGIPPFRLPRDILDFEVNSLKDLGVEIRLNTIIGRTKSLDELFREGYASVFLGLGAGVPGMLGIGGENLCNVYSANEFLTRVNLMHAYRFPQFHTPVNIGKKVVVIGGGNTAMDAARASLRLQKMSGLEPDTTVLYRRSEIEMPARRLEIEHARQEGIAFEFLVQPQEFSGDEKGFVKKLTCLRCNLGSPDASGRRRPVAIQGSEFSISCDLAIVAVGLKANRLLTQSEQGLSVNQDGDITVDQQTMETSREHIFAGGDIVGGEGTVIEAMGMAKKAAAAVIEKLKKA